MENKRNDINIYVYGYQKVDYDLPDNSLYIPVQCGSEQADEIWLSTGDNTGDNISEMNHFYAECTGTYWVWKNRLSSLRYVGQCQYRKWMLFDENLDFDMVFSKCDVILPEPLRLGMSIREHYGKCHNGKDLAIIEEIVKEMFPDYYDSLETILNGNLIYYGAGFIMRVDDYREYCEFMFGVLDEFRNRLGLGNMKDVENHVLEGIADGSYHIGADTRLWYQSLIGGFMAERLLSAFIIKKFKKQMLMKYILK